MLIFIVRYHRKLTNNAIGSTRGQLRSCWPFVTSGHTHELTIEPSCRTESYSVPPFVRMILPALYTYGHENGWAPVFCDSIWTQQESVKMHQNGIIRPKMECSSRNWDPNLDRAFSFPSILEWNDKTCQFCFYKVSTFSYFHIDLWRHF